MRQLKFRAWHTYSKEMFTDGIMIVDGQIKENGDVVVMQFTGLLDKNGKEIYEGDVYEMWGFPNDEGQMQMERHEVKWPEFLIDWYAPKESNLDIEIIGNIYENKDLLK